MECRTGCGACCIAISISSHIPGLPDGKPAGDYCIHLSCNRECRIFDHPDRPQVCKDFMAEKEICGNNYIEAMINLTDLENKT